MKKIFAVFLLVLCSLTFSNCKKKEQQPDLPPITTTGENTFGCYIGLAEKESSIYTTWYFLKE